MKGGVCRRLRALRTPTMSLVMRCGARMACKAVSSRLGDVKTQAQSGCEALIRGIGV
jgi:hypothetical protein